MDDDGPRPMKHKKPVKKWSTAAERFKKEHHGEYEARCPKYKDKVKRVNVHNNACPKLYDELGKRRSIANPTTARQKTLRISSTTKSSGIRKPKSRKKRHYSKLTFKNQGTQYTNSIKLEGKSRSITDGDMPEPGPSNIEKNNSKDNILNTNTENSDLKSKDTKGSIATLSSYNSYFSMDHEPMV